MLMESHLILFSTDLAIWFTDYAERQNFSMGNLSFCYRPHLRDTRSKFQQHCSASIISGLPVEPRNCRKSFFLRNILIFIYCLIGFNPFRTARLDMWALMSFPRSHRASSAIHASRCNGIHLLRLHFISATF